MAETSTTLVINAAKTEFTPTTQYSILVININQWSINSYVN